MSSEVVPQRSLPPVPKPRGIFDPVARGLDVIGDRWTLVLVRHLLKGNRGFQALRKRARAHPMEDVGARLRGLMPWLKEKRLVDRAKN